MQKLFKNKLFLSILSGLLLCLGWSHLSMGWVMFIAFIPLLLVHDKLQKSYNKAAGAEFLGYSFLSFLIWNVFAVWWITNATVAGALLSIMMPAVLMSGVMFLNFIFYKSLGKRLGYLVFVTNWIAIEYILMNNQMAWPWMILGNSFAFNISLIQWYEYLGNFGGTLWILGINLLIFELIKLIQDKQSKLKIRNYSIALTCVIILPISFSLIRYFTYEEKVWPVDIVIIQPNMDPYNVKFKIPIDQQLDVIVALAESKADQNVDYFVGPETAIPNGMWEETINDNIAIKFIRSFISKYPDAKFIIGADSRMLYKNGNDKTETATKFGKSDDYWDIFNSALQVDTSLEVPIYHKSKLVSGVEAMPYAKTLSFLSDLMMDFGGIAGSKGTQDYREVFENKQTGLKVGVPVCFESDFGKFFGEFVNKGANVLFVITNDGWWGDTPGYKRHRAYSQIRAIETRRSIARSANTGISCFINQRGDVLQEIGWWQVGALRQTINANDKITFYVQYGDFIARMCLTISIILFSILLLSKLMSIIKRDKL
jgi:apolipoprotein N-acyltransferase